MKNKEERRQLYSESTQNQNKKRNNGPGEITASNMTKSRYPSEIKTLYGPSVCLETIINVERAKQSKA